LPFSSVKLRKFHNVIALTVLVSGLTSMPSA